MKNLELVSAAMFSLLPPLDCIVMTRDVFQNVKISAALTGANICSGG